MQVFLSKDELDALTGQVPELWQFYVVLKKFMDYSTGVVGIQRGISWQSLREEMYVEPGQGLSGTGAPTKAKVRRLCDRAQRISLIEDKSTPVKLIFFLPLAPTDQSARKKPGTKSARSRHTQPGTPESQESIAETMDCEPVELEPGMNSAHHESPKPGTPPLSVYPEEERGTNVPVELPLDAELSATPSVPAPPATPAQPLPVTVVFDYWRKATGHAKARLDDKRRKVIAARIKDGYRVEDLKRAVDGCLASPWHQGQNGNKRKYDDIELICRNASKVDQFIALAHSGNDEQAELDAWFDEVDAIEGECRHVG